MTAGASAEKAQGLMRRVLDFLLSGPGIHHRLYEREPGFTHEDWRKHRTSTYRFRPEPCLVLRVASGLWQLLLLVVVISVLVCLYFDYLVPLGAPDSFVANLSSLLTIATFAMSLLMVFKLNTSYSRWWEARTQWGTNLAAMRNYMRQLVLWCPPDKRYVIDAAVRWLPACMLLLKEHLRDGGDGLAACSSLLLPHEVLYLKAHRNMPLAAAHVLSQFAAEINISPILQAQLETQISNYVLMAAGNERILRTPIPRGYTRFTSRCVVMYICIIPLLLWPTCKWLTPVVALIIAFMILGVENVGVQIEEPFRVLHLESMCAATEQAAQDLGAWGGPFLSRSLDLQHQGSQHKPRDSSGSTRPGSKGHAQGSWLPASEAAAPGGFWTPAVEGQQDSNAASAGGSRSSPEGAAPGSETADPGAPRSRLHQVHSSGPPVAEESASLSSVPGHGCVELQPGPLSVVGSCVLGRDNSNGSGGTLGMKQPEQLQVLQGQQQQGHWLPGSSKDAEEQHEQVQEHVSDTHSMSPLVLAPQYSPNSDLTSSSWTGPPGVHLTGPDRSATVPDMPGQHAITLVVDASEMDRRSSCPLARNSRNEVLAP